MGVDQEFAAFARRNYLMLVRRGYLLTGDRGEAEDLAQDALAALLVAWRRGSLLDPDRYVARTLTNRAVSRWRRRSSKDLITDLVPDRAHTADSVEDDRDLLRRSLLRLPPRQRAVLVLRYFEDLPDAEIADQMGITAATVRSQTARAVETLRRDGALRAGMEGVR